MDVQKELATLLKKEYKKRRDKNPSYSLRSFARFLGVDQSVLSKMLRRQRNFSFPMWEKCLLKLDLDLDQRENLYKGWDAEFKPQGVCESNLQTMNSWKCWAILEFLKVNNHSSHSEISKNLGIHTGEVKKIITYMIEHGFLEFNDGQFTLLRPDNQWFSQNTTSEERRDLQKQFLKRSIDSIDSVSLDKRFHGSLTMAINPKDIPKLKEKMEKIIKKLGKFANNVGAEEVYQVTVSLFPLKGQYE